MLGKENECSKKCGGRAAKVRVPAAKSVTANGRGASSDGSKVVAELSWSPATQLMLPCCFPNVMGRRTRLSSFISRKSEQLLTLFFSVRTAGK